MDRESFPLIFRKEPAMRVSRVHTGNFLPSLLWLMIVWRRCFKLCWDGLPSRSTIERTADHFRSDAASRRCTTTSRHSHRRSCLSWS